MSINTASGVRVSIAGVHAPATDTAAEYAALTWVEIGEIESGGEIGDESSVVTFAALADARVRKLKGTRDAGSFIITVGKDALNAGQIAAKAAEKTKFEYDFKLEFADKPNPTGTNTITYFYGPVFSARDNVGGNDNVVRTTINVGVNGAPAEVPATVGS